MLSSEPAPAPQPHNSRLRRFIDQLRVYAGFARSVPFWGVVFTFGLLAGTFGGFNVHLFLYYTELGVDEYWATLVLSVSSAVAIASKPLFGLLIDHINPRVATMISCACCLCAMLVLSSFDALALFVPCGRLLWPRLRRHDSSARSDHLKALYYRPIRPRLRISAFVHVSNDHFVDAADRLHLRHARQLCASVQSVCGAICHGLRRGLCAHTQRNCASLGLSGSPQRERRMCSISSDAAA